MKGEKEKFETANSVEVAARGFLGQVYKARPNEYR